jgi:hypothetical protein
MSIGEALLKLNPWRQAAINARAERDAALQELESARQDLRHLEQDGLVLRQLLDIERKLVQTLRARP